MPIADRMLSVWNAFRNPPVVNPMALDYPSGGTTTVHHGSLPPSSPRMVMLNDKSIIGSIYTRLSIDVASVDIVHVLLDDQDRYKEDAESDLNWCLKHEPNMDQGPRAFRQDIALTMFSEGVAVVVPVDTTRNPNTNEIFDIQQLRVGTVVDWHASQVKVSVWNQETAKREEVLLDKRYVAIIQNPLHAVMNEPSSTLQRLLRKLQLLDGIDEQTGSGKLDIIIQMPFSIRSDARREQAENRLSDIEWQLKGSQHGIAYADATEKITQLNRPVENNLLKQIEYLTKLLYEQLGLTEDVMNGTADEAAMRNYQNRTVEPVVDAVREAMFRSFIGRERWEEKNEYIQYFMDPFKLVPVGEIAEIADKMVRNQVLVPNEIRGVVGFKPRPEPQADELRNPNMPENVNSNPADSEPTDSVT